jgi:hypothetical protein
MPIVVQYTTNVDVDIYDEVVTDIEFHDDLPDGLMVHTAAISEDGRMRVFDIWRTRAAYEDFDRMRLRPALARLLGEDFEEHAVDLEVHDLHSLVSPVHTTAFG